MRAGLPLATHRAALSPPSPSPPQPSGMAVLKEALVALLSHLMRWMLSWYEELGGESGPCGYSIGAGLDGDTQK